MTLGAEAFEALAMPYLERLAERLKDAYPDVPLLVFARGVEDPLATGGVVGERLSHTPRRASSGERIPAAPPGLSTSFRPLHDTNARNTQHTTTT